MFPHRCPDMDRLSRELIDAYRNIDDQTIFQLRSGSVDDGGSVSAIHRAMGEHRDTCTVCLKIARGMIAEEISFLRA